MVETTRGCFGRCTFCIASNYLKGISFKPPEQVIEEISFLYEIGFSRFFLTDDNFTASFQHANTVLEAIKNSNLEISMEINVRADSLLRCLHEDSSFLKKAKASGLKVIHLGIESGSPYILERCRKDIELSEVKKAVQEITSAGLTVEINFILGFPDDDRKTIQESIDLALRLQMSGPVILHLSTFMPYPGTVEYNRAVEQELFDPRTLDLSQLHAHKGAIIPTYHLSKGEIDNLYEKFYSEYYSLNYMRFLHEYYPHVYDTVNRQQKNRRLSISS